ncbi:MAG TPA: hypothetical protein VLA61_10245 [Ideonella sp.]|uniref:coiled-coil domain-containing protein n=1 Tax=Ideonella sp. TaxID=1929293 RepID=UPI002CB2E7A1|nr:hypothetical protein [Ideonella sp.]HSI48640.1 hypothetical protein [Ideonella sp.]
MTTTPITISDLTTANTNGTGVFDILMRSVQGYLDSEVTQGRIKEPEYATAYLASMSLAMQTGLQFVLAQQKTALDAQLLEQQITLASLEVQKAQIELAILTADQAKVPAELAEIPAQMALADQQKSKLETLHVLPKQGLTLDAQKTLATPQTLSQADADHERTQASFGKSSQETATPAQKAATEQVETSVVTTDSETVVTSVGGMTGAVTLRQIGLPPAYAKDVVGDGIVDDYPAMQAMVNSLRILSPITPVTAMATTSPTTIDLSGRTIKLSQPLDLNNLYNIKFINGKFIADSTVSWTGKSLISLVSYSGATPGSTWRQHRIKYISFENIEFDGNNVTPVVVKLQTTYEVSFYRCRAVHWQIDGKGWYTVPSPTPDANNQGSYLTNNTQLRLSHCNASWRQHGEEDGSSSGTGIEINTSDCHIDSCVNFGCDIGFAFDHCYNVKFSNCHSYVGSDKYCLVIGPDAHSVWSTDFYGDTGIIELRSFCHSFVGGGFVANSKFRLHVSQADEALDGLVLQGVQFANQPTVEYEGSGSLSQRLRASFNNCRRPDGSPIRGVGSTSYWLGDVTAPTIVFNDFAGVYSTTGFYSPTPNQVALTAESTAQVMWNAEGTVLTNRGTISRPSLRWGDSANSVDSTSGWYSPQANRISTVSNGIVMQAVSETGHQFYRGTRAVPSLRFRDATTFDSDSGFYSPASDQVAFAASDVRIIRLDRTGVLMKRGTVSSPTLRFGNDPSDDTGSGWYSQAVDEWALGSAGVMRFASRPNGVVLGGQLGVSLPAPTLTISGGTLTLTTGTQVFFAGGGTLNTITVPSLFSGGGGYATIIPTASITTTTAGNIKEALTMVANKQYRLYYDSDAGKWFF